MGIKDRVGKKLVNQGARLIGEGLIIEDEDGYASLVPAKFTPGVGFEVGDEVYEADSSSLVTFAGARVAFAHANIASVLSLPSASIARNVEEQIENGELEEAVEKGDDIEVEVPRKATVKLRDVLKLRPYSITPEAMARVKRAAIMSEQVRNKDRKWWVEIGAYLTFLIMGLIAPRIIGVGGGAGGDLLGAIPLP